MKSIFLPLLMLSALVWNTGVSYAQTTVAAGKPVYGGTLMAGMPLDLRNLNAAIFNATRTGQLVSVNLFDGLLRHSTWGDGKLTPELAKSWKVSSDGLIYTFDLERGVKWHDGKPFTSADVKFGIQGICQPHHPVGRLNFSNIGSIDTPDDYTVVIKLKTFDAAFLGRLDPKWCAIAPKHLYEGTDIPNNKYNWAPVGTGPFKFKEWVRGSHMIFEKNENYWQKGPNGERLPFLDRLVFRVIPDETTLISSLESGSIDYIPPLDVVPSSEIPRLNKTKGIKTVTWPYANKDIFFLFYNTSRPMTGNVDVRHALAYLVDTQDIITRVFSGSANASSSRDVGFITWFTGTSAPHYGYDLKRAEDLLDKAGYKKDKDGKRFQLNLTITTESPEFLQMANLLKTSYARAGVVLDIKVYDAAAATERVYKKLDYDLHIQTVAVGPDPYLLSKTWHSSNIGAGWITNASGYKNPKMDQMLEEGVRIVDVGTRKAAYAAIQNVLMTDLPMLPIASSLKVFVFNDQLGGFPIGYTYRETLAGVHWLNAIPKGR